MTGLDTWLITGSTGQYSPVFKNMLSSTANSILSKKEVGLCIYLESNNRYLYA